MSSYIYEVVKTEPDVPVRCFRYWDPIGYPVAAHWHNSVEILRIDSGRMQVMLGDKHIELGPEDYLIINSRDIHATFSEKNSLVEVLQIPYVFMKRYLPGMDTLRFCRKPQEREISGQVSALLHRMSAVNTLREENFLVEFHALLFQLLYLLSVHYGEKAGEEEAVSKDADRQRLTKVMDYVNLHYREKITLADAASQVALNKEYFCRFFKKGMGTSFLEYVNEVRFTHVCEDLFHTEENIMTLLEEHGFGNYKLFMKMFRQRYHDTPSRMRRESRGAGEKETKERGNENDRAKEKVGKSREKRQIG